MKRRDTKYGSYKGIEIKSLRKGIKKGQRGLVVSRGGGNNFGLMGGGLFGESVIYGQDEGVRANPYVVHIQKDKIDWTQKEPNFKEIYGLLGKMRSPVDIGRLFNIEGLDLKQLLPSDQQAFNLVKTQLMNKYLGEIRDRFPNLTQEELMKGDNNMFIQEVLQRYKNSVINLFNTMKSNKDMFEKEEGSRKDLEKTVNENAMYFDEYRKHYNVGRYGTLAGYMQAYGEDWANALLDELENRGTASGAITLGSVKNVMPLNLSKYIHENFVKEIKGDSFEQIKSQNKDFLSKEQIAGIGYSDITKKAKGTMLSVMEAKENGTDFMIKGREALSNLFQQNGLSDIAGVIEGVSKNAKPMAQTFNALMEKMDRLNQIQKEIGQEKDEKKKEQLNKEAEEIKKLLSDKNNLTAMKAGVLLFTKRGIGEANRELYSEVTSDEQYKKALDVIEEKRRKGEPVTFKVKEITLPNGTKRRYIIQNTLKEEGAGYLNKDGNVIKKKVVQYKDTNRQVQIKEIGEGVDADQVIDEIIKNGGQIIQFAEVPKNINELDTEKDKVDFLKPSEIGSDDSMKVFKNAILPQVFEEMVSAAVPILHNKIGVDIIPLPKPPQVHVSNINSAGGTTLEERKDNEWRHYSMRINQFNIGKETSASVLFNEFIVPDVAVSGTGLGTDARLPVHGKSKEASNLLTVDIAQDIKDGKPKLNIFYDKNGNSLPNGSELLTTAKKEDIHIVNHLIGYKSKLTDNKLIMAKPLDVVAKNLGEKKDFANAIMNATGSAVNNDLVFYKDMFMQYAKMIKNGEGAIAPLMADTLKQTIGEATINEINSIAKKQNLSQADIAKSLMEKVSVKNANDRMQVLIELANAYGMINYIPTQLIAYKIKDELYFAQVSDFTSQNANNAGRENIGQKYPIDATTYTGGKKQK